LLRRLDTISTRYPALLETGVDLRPELTRLETVHGDLCDKDRIVVQALGGPGEAAQLRTQYRAPESHWWWYLDERVAQRRAKKLRRLAWGALAGAIVVAILAALYVRFLRPDEATRQRLEYVFNAESAIQRGEYDAALRAYQNAIEVAPDDAEAMLMVGVMYEALGGAQEAEEQYAKAEAIYGSRAVFLAARAQQYNLLGWYDRAAADSLAAIELDDSLAHPYCTLASAYEGQQKIPQAIAAFQTCADKAREQDKNELYVIAITRMATLMQMP
jgi:tetratricopeptide (TPR) repeat protein